MESNNDFDEQELKALLDKARQLPREVAPGSEAWSKIQSRIESGRVIDLTSRIDAGATPHERVPTVQSEHEAASVAAGDQIDRTNADDWANKRAKNSWFQQSRFALAAAAVLFFSVTSLVVMRDRANDQDGSTITVASGSSASGSAVAANNATSPPATSDMKTDTSPSASSDVANVPSASATIAAVIAQYDEATNDLARDLDKRRARLQPEAVAVIDSCLTTIDRAIQESRTALREAPDNTVIADLLQLTYQQKLDLLRRAADLPLGSH